MNIYYAPNQSEATKDICRHFTKREKRVGIFLGGFLGLWIATIMSFIPFIITTQLEKPFSPFSGLSYLKE